MKVQITNFMVISLVPDENYTVTFDEPGLYLDHDPAWSHIRGVITVEYPEFSSELGLISNDSSVNGIDENPGLDSNITNVINSNVDGLATSEDGSSSFPLSSFSSSFPNSTTNNVSDQPSTPSSPSSDHALANIFNKIGPLLGLLMNENTSSSSSTAITFLSLTI